MKIFNFFRKKAGIKTQPKTEAQPKEKPVKVGPKKERIAPRVFLRPLITEKGTQATTAQHYVFAVYPAANKNMIRQAIEEVYGVRPQAVHIIQVRGKDVRFGRSRGRTKNWKKAIVILKPGDKIETMRAV